ncbi:unnamed protein product [Adineta steineri]|uniref:Uncharacterized protein n=1 Tax=Adineta steineri TaxID=433720 RepID=A0A814KIR3_9BILA|nr:unnamed protein product [Adineta steineri]CAF3971245.1 unnamed protein product [Adineta steineri]
MRLLLLVIFLFHYCHSTVDLLFQIQPHSVRINNQDEIYITSDDHYIGQVLYRSDQIQLACDCQTQLNKTQYNIYWAINNKIIDQYRSLNSIHLIIDKNNVQAPITYVSCHCVFILPNLKQIKRNYRYQLYIDLESEPSLKPIIYSVELNMIKGHFYDFLRRHSILLVSFTIILIGITCSLVILSFLPFSLNFID